MMMMVAVVAAVVVAAVVVAAVVVAAVVVMVIDSHIKKKTPRFHYFRLDPRQIFFMHFSTVHH